MLLTYQCKLIPTQKQRQQLDGYLNNERVLYNAALEERISYHHLKNRSYFDQSKALTEWRQSDPEAGQERLVSASA